MAAAAALAAGYGITAVTLSQTLSGGGKDTEKAGPKRPIQRRGERAGEAGGWRARGWGMQEGRICWGRQEKAQWGGTGLGRVVSALSYTQSSKENLGWGGVGGYPPQGPEDWGNYKD